MRMFMSENVATRGGVSTAYIRECFHSLHQRMSPLPTSENVFHCLRQRMSPLPAVRMESWPLSVRVSDPVYFLQSSTLSIPRLYNMSGIIILILLLLIHH